MPRNTSTRTISSGSLTSGLRRKKLAQLTIGPVIQFRDDLEGAGVSVPTTRKILAMLQVILAYLISLDLLAININEAKGVEVIGRREGAPTDHPAQ